ncbi:MAG: 16S rRNA (uracil(1498)-N(3))-methyltransferase [Gammaproteobacteria bacterium]|nr:16S rRNA (uracil(1498)-N(3))-methyltransferase [Gammaproteobacteria bacterium]
MTQRLNRIFLDQSIEVEKEIDLPAEAVRHLSTVLKIRENDEIVLFNNTAAEYLARVVLSAKRQVKVIVCEARDVNVESPLTIHLVQAVARGEKMDWIIQKSVELGVSEITPMFSERTGVKLSQDRLTKKLEHWQKVIVSACEQCGRNTLPVLHQPISFDELCKDQQLLENAIQLYPHSGASITELPKYDRYVLIIGPEGGLSESEVALLNSKNVNAIKMGPRILRTETAGLAAISVLQATFGDLG